MTEPQTPCPDHGLQGYRTQKRPLMNRPLVMSKDSKEAASHDSTKPDTCSQKKRTPLLSPYRGRQRGKCDIWLSGSKTLCPEDECSKKQPNIQRIMDFSKENIHAASNEMFALVNLGHKSRIHITKQLVHILKAHLPNAIQELQDLNLRETHQKEITKCRRELKVINAEHIKMRKQVRCLAKKNDELVQKLTVMKDIESTHNIVIASQTENTQGMNSTFEMIYENNLMEEQLFYKENETASLKESCISSTKLQMQVYQLQQEKKDIEDKLNHELALEKEEKEKYLLLQSEFRESLRKIANAEVKIKLQASEISLLKLENDKTEQLKKENIDLYQAVCNYIRGKKRIQEQLDKKHEENITLRQTIKTQLSEICERQTKHNDHLDKLRTAIDNSYEEKEKLQEKIAVLEQSETKTIENIQLSFNKRYEQLKIELDKQIHENLKHNEEADLIKEISEMQNAKYRSLQVLLKERMQEINTLQHNIAVKDEERKREIDKLFQENQTLKKDLAHEKESLKIQVKEHDDLNLIFQKEKQNLIEERNCLELYFEIQLYEQKKQHQEEAVRLQEHNKRQVEEFLLKRENNEKQKENTTQYTNQKFRNLLTKISQLETENKTLQEALEREKQKAQVIDEEYKRNFYENQQIKKSYKSETENFREAIQVQQQLRDDNVGLRKEVDHIKTESGKQLEENASLQKEYTKQKALYQQIIKTQMNEIAKLKLENQRLVVEAQKIARNSQFVDRHLADRKLRQQPANIREQLIGAQELDETKQSLSRAIGDQLTDNKSDIADLSDPNRPTKISERYQELYDNQWADAFEIINETIKSEEKTIEILVDILMETLIFCKAASTDQMTTITETLSKGNELPASIIHLLNDLRKSSAESYGNGLYKDYLKNLNVSKSPNAKMALKVPVFAKECFEICWLMVVQDPSLVLGPEIHRDVPFNKDHYNAYTKCGNILDYIVWPVLLLYKDGPVLCKGVAQCR